MLDRRKHSRPPEREEFFRTLAILSEIERIRIYRACVFAGLGHFWQTRDDGKTPYVVHSLEAAWIFIYELKGTDSRVIVSTLLHDVPENQKSLFLVFLFTIGISFGLEMFLDTQSITKRRMETVEEYLERIIARGPELVLVKLLDRLHNLRTLDACPPKKRKKQIRETRRFHLPILIRALRSFGGTWAVHADRVEVKILEAMARYS